MLLLTYVPLLLLILPWGSLKACVSLVFIPITFLLTVTVIFSLGLPSRQAAFYSVVVMTPDPRLQIAFFIVGAFGLLLRSRIPQKFKQNQVWGLDRWVLE